MSEALSDKQVEATQLTEEDLRANSFGELSVTGFSVMCAWHFLALFTATPAAGEFALGGRPFVLQLIFCLSLGVSYGVLAFASKPIINTLYHRGKRWSVANVSTGLVATASSILAVFSIGTELWQQVIVFVLLGLSQALLMFPWLQLPRVSDDRGGNYRNLSFNMGIGGIIAILITSLNPPLFHVGFCALPLIANVLVVVYWNRSKHVKDSDEFEGRPRLSASDTIRANTHFIVYGLVFGLCQFTFSAALGTSDTITYVMNGMWPLIGIIVSSVILYLMPVRFFRIAGIFTVQRFGMLLFISGVILATYFMLTKGSFAEPTETVGNYTSQALFLAGFNIFDFGFMVTSFAWAARLETDFAAYIGFNRSALYASMGAGLGLGWLIDYLLSPLIPALPLAVAGLAIVLLCITTLPFFDDFAPYARIVSAEKRRREDEKRREEREALAAEALAAEEKARTARWSERVNAIADEFELSKREREILFYLAKGRNAAFIQQELWISIHTVKTHISNIYRKLDVHSIQEVIDMVDKPSEPAADDPDSTKADG